MTSVDLVVVGAGLFGMTIAERAAQDLGLSVAIIDKRSHIGGNSDSMVEANTGIEVHRYGAHLFHTSDERVWKYVNQFTGFTNYVHHVYTTHRGVVYPMPVNLGTINQFFQAAYSPAEARALVADQATELAGQEPSNFVEKGVQLVGRPLYEAFFMNYTAKQWQTAPEDLPASIISRLPVRYTYDNRYFNDTHEGLPVEGYHAWFERMLDHPRIDVHLETDFFDTNASLSKIGAVGSVPVVYTGPIDRYFDYAQGSLSWRTVDLEQEIVPVEDFQGCSVMNYADADVPYTRILEFRHFHPERSYTREATVINREYARFAGADDDPYYPVSTAQDTARLQIYQAMAADEPVLFGGRLGTYKYFDMHQAIAAALDLYDRNVKPHFVDGTSFNRAQTGDRA